MGTCYARRRTSTTLLTDRHSFAASCSSPRGQHDRRPAWDARTRGIQDIVCQLRALAIIDRAPIDKTFGADRLNFVFSFASPAPEGPILLGCIFVFMRAFRQREHAEKALSYCIRENICVCYARRRASRTWGNAANRLTPVRRVVRLATGSIRPTAGVPRRRTANSRCCVLATRASDPRLRSQWQIV